MKTTDTTLFVLGAADPEMEAIERLLREAGVPFVYASTRGVRVHPGTMYAATTPVPAPGQVWVECAPRDGSAPRAIDHHRPGDPGFGRPPAEFMQASSIGQVLALLAAEGHLTWVTWESDYMPEDGCQYADAYWPDDPWSAWIVADRGSSQVPGGGRWAEIPYDLVLCAAADHCLGAAYRGECPGVDSTALADWRAHSRAEFQRVPIAQIVDAIAAARLALHTAPVIELTDGVYARDMRGPVVPELPEAAAQMAEAYVSGPMRSPDGRQKFTCSGRPEHVHAFLDGWAAAQGIVDLYGDPARGFAGGYV